MGKYSRICKNKPIMLDIKLNQGSSKLNNQENKPDATPASYKFLIFVGAIIVVATCLAILIKKPSTDISSAKEKWLELSKLLENLLAARHPEFILIENLPQPQVESKSHIDIDQVPLLPETWNS